MELRETGEQIDGQYLPWPPRNYTGVTSIAVIIEGKEILCIIVLAFNLLILTRSRPPGALHKWSAQSLHSVAKASSLTRPKARPTSRASSFSPTMRICSFSSFSISSSASLSFSSLAWQ